MLSNHRSLLTFVGLIPVFLLILVQSNNQNQVVGPIPNSERPSIVRKLPELAAALQRAKSLCEGRATSVKATMSRQRVRRRGLGDGKRLYDDAKTAVDSCITYLKVGLSRRFDNDDPRHVRELLSRARERVARFVGWADGLTEGQTGAGTDDPITAALGQLTDWLKGVSEANDRAIEQLRDDLERCRLKSWGDLN